MATKTRDEQADGPAEQPGKPAAATVSPAETQSPATATETAAAREPDALPSRARLPLWLIGLAGLAAAWLLPLATHLIRVDWLLPLVIWGFTASLLRSGRSTLDRLMLAAVLLIGATTVAGLVMSVWPWGLAPVPVAGFALSALVLLAVGLRRRPHLPWPPRGSDYLAIGAGLLAAAVVGLPFVGRGFAYRMSLMVPGEDMARHFSLYDAIGIVQHYAFIDRRDSDPYLLYGMQTYPQGSHFLYALLDKFLRSGAAPANPIDSWDHFVDYHVLGYAFLAVAIVWATRWVAGPALIGWHKVAIYTFVGAAVSFSELVAIFIRGYPSEIMGLALFAVLLALLARPPRHTRELLVTVAALIAGICWAYFFLLPLVGLVALASLIGYRHRLRAHWVTALLVALVTVPLALAPYLIMYADRGSPLADLLPRGPAEAVDRRVTVGIAAALLAALATAPRSPVRRMIGVQLVLVAGTSVALGVYQILSIGHLSYYFDKAVHALFVTCLVGLSGVTPLLAKIRRPQRTAAGWRRWQQAAVAVMIVFGVLAYFGAVPLSRPGAKDGEPWRSGSWGTTYAVGKLRNKGVGMVVAEVLRRYPDSDGRITQVIFGNRSSSYLSSLFTTVLYRNQGAIRRQTISPTPLYHDEYTGETVADYAAKRRIIVVNSPQTAEALKKVLSTRPDLDIDVVSIHVAVEDAP
jgi:hypothetical protein